MVASSGASRLGDNVDIAKARRESMRWFCLTALEAARPGSIPGSTLFLLMRDRYPDVSESEVLRNLDYLVLHGLAVMTTASDAVFFQMTGLGVDVVEFNADCPAGIARLNE